MTFLFDIILIIVSIFIAYKSYKSVVFNKNFSIASLLILVIFIFNVLPIILNYIIGIPDYKVIYWYKPFINPMKNDIVNTIYDLYILFSLILLYIYAERFNKLNLNKVSAFKKSESYQLIFNNNIFCFIAILSPIILIFMTGTWRNYLTYNISATRGLSESASSMFMTPLLLLSTFTFYSRFYNDKKINFLKLFLTFVYFFFIIWLSGKRFMLANLSILLIFYASKGDLNLKIRKKIFKILPLIFIGILSFSYVYLTVVRPLKDTSFSSVYDMLRVDFGRDDVVKYVINEEIINDNRILDYRGQSFISLFLFMIPRKIWSNKPYPHYMYLTGHLLNLNINNLPAGTTPSWYEMCICNFGVFGIFIGILFLPFICKIADKSRNIDTKAIWLILLIVLLTQSMDAYIVYIFILVFVEFLNALFGGKKIKIKVR